MKMCMSFVLMLVLGAGIHSQSPETSTAPPPADAVGHSAPAANAQPKPAQAARRPEPGEKPPVQKPASPEKQDTSKLTDTSKAATLAVGAKPPQKPPVALEVQKLFDNQQVLLAQQQALLGTVKLWLIPLAIATLAMSAGASTVILVLLRRRRTAAQKIDDLAPARELTAASLNLGANLRIVEDRLQHAAAALDERISSAKVLTVDDFIHVSENIARLETEILRVVRMVEELATAPPSSPELVAVSPGDQVSLERQILAEHWKQFRDKRHGGDDTSPEHPWEPLLNDLGSHVPQELRPTFDSVMGPYRDYSVLAKRIAIIPRVVAGEFERLSPAAEVMRTRELISLLGTLQSSDGASRLQFQFKTWVTDTFLPFADLYLQKYQQATLEKRGMEMQKGMSLVRQLLRIAAVEPIEVTPGETPFDSTRHIGRSTSSDPRFSDGVITGVVRNGFIEGGQLVIRQPEVIVNRR